MSAQEEWPPNWVMVQLTYNYGTLGQRQTLHQPVMASEAVAALRADPKVSCLTIRGIDANGEVVAPAAVELKTRTLSEKLAYCINKLNEQLAPSQAVVDGVALALTQLMGEVIDLENAVAVKEAPPAEEDIFEVGRIVVLKSRLGPLMTVTHCGEDYIQCTWFDEAERIYTAEIPRNALFLKKGDQPVFQRAF